MCSASLVGVSQDGHTKREEQRWCHCKNNTRPMMSHIYMEANGWWSGEVVGMN